MAVKRTYEEAHADVKVTSVQDKDSVIVGSFFNGFHAPKDAKIDVYKRKSTKETIFHGENSRLDYNGTPADNDNDYALAVYDPVTRSVELYKVPVLLGSVTSKEHRKLKGPAVKQTHARFIDQKNALGEAFGTRKAKKVIADQARNRIDADQLAEVQTDIIDSVKSTTTNLPSRQELTEKVLNDRPTPVANVDAADVADIYPIDNLISSTERDYIRVDPILNETNTKEKLELLPFQDDSFLAKRIAGETDPTKLQLIYYASLLLGLYNNRRISDKRSLITALNNPPDVLVDGLLERFATAKAGVFGRTKERAFRIDPHHEDKLLCYFLAVTLHIDNFHVEISPLSNELSLKPSRLVGLFKALGCNVRPITASEADLFGVPRAAASSYKIAALKVPFKLPEMTRRGRRA